MSSELVYTTSASHQGHASPNAPAVSGATIRFECGDDDSYDGWVVIGPCRMQVHRLDAEPCEDRIASFIIYGKRWHEYWMRLFEDRVEVSCSFYDASQGDPPLSAFDERDWVGRPASFFRYVKDELYPDYLEARGDAPALEAVI